MKGNGFCLNEILTRNFPRMAEEEKKYQSYLVSVAREVQNGAPLEYKCRTIAVE
jgi:hypothetical protein